MRLRHPLPHTDGGNRSEQRQQIVPRARSYHLVQAKCKVESRFCRQLLSSQCFISRTFPSPSSIHMIPVGTPCSCNGTCCPLSVVLLKPSFMNYIWLAKVDPQETESGTGHLTQTELINSFQWDFFLIQREISFSLWMVSFITWETWVVLDPIFSSIWSRKRKLI